MTRHKLITSPMQSQDPDGISAGKCLCGESSFTRIRRHGPGCRATKQVTQERAESPGCGWREIDRRHVYTDGEGLWDGIMPVLAGSTSCLYACMHVLAGTPTLPWARETRQLRYFDDLLVCGFPHSCLASSEGCCLHSRMPESFHVRPAWYSEKMPTKSNWHLRSNSILGIAYESSESKIK